MLVSMAKGDRPAMTAMPMTISTTGHQPHACLAVSSGMTPVWMASATRPAVTRAIPQKTRPRFMRMGHDSPARMCTLLPTAAARPVPAAQAERYGLTARVLPCAYIQPIAQTGGSWPPRQEDR